MLTLTRGRYGARLAASEADVVAAQRLRWRAFRADAGRPEGLDADGFDADCAHMLVEDLRDGRLVCCFRLMHLPSADLCRRRACRSRASVAACGRGYRRGQRAGGADQARGRRAAARRGPA
jgi:predicted GNAT family N-acyltransferase